jgi:predicted nucleotidyltransferase
VDFDRAWDHRVEADFEGVTITYISLDDLIVAKRAAGRDQDHLDLQILEEAKKLRNF